MSVGGGEGKTEAGMAGKPPEVFANADAVPVGSAGVGGIGDADMGGSPWPDNAGLSWRVLGNGGGARLADVKDVFRGRAVCGTGGMAGTGSYSVEALLCRPIWDGRRPG